MRRLSPALDEALAARYRARRRAAAKPPEADRELARLIGRLARRGADGVPPSKKLDKSVAAAFAALAAGERSGRRRSPVVRRTLVDEFHRLYYHAPERTWQNTYFLGVPIWKNPLDLWVYQELIHELRPDVIVEAGTKYGGSAYYFARLFDLLGAGEVVTIDVEPQPNLPEHPRITYVTGSSTDPAVFARVSETVGDRRVLIALDSSHERDHVLAELRTWSPLVPVGSYVVVEDTHADGHPIRTQFGPGPWDAVATFLAEDDAFEADSSRHKFFLTWNPRGYLKRIAAPSGANRGRAGNP